MKDTGFMAQWARFASGKGKELAYWRLLILLGQRQHTMAHFELRGVLLVKTRPLHHMRRVGRVLIIFKFFVCG